MTLPRLLRGLTPAPMDYQRHRLVHGNLPGPSAYANVLRDLKRAGLRGRGGAGFPLAVKLDAVRRAGGRAVVVANGCECEPMSAKDRMLLTSLPHLVIDGALCLARALSGAEVMIAVDEFNVTAGEAVQWALTQRPDVRRGHSPPEILWVPTGYVSGQESAIVRWCNEGVAKPGSIPPRITERGIARRPTLVCNVETLAHVALLVRHGAEWFRELGTDDDPGSGLVTLSGAVRRPGVYELELGSSLSGLLSTGGGPAEPIRALLLGGYAGGWVDAGLADRLTLSTRDLRSFDARLGAGVVVALPASACPVAETVRLAGWLADQSAAQCGPCVNGLAAVADRLGDIREGIAGERALSEVVRWCQLAAGRGACAHPDGTASFVTSALNVFAAEFKDHTRHGLCDACEHPGVLLTAPHAGVAA